jgi:hypothetical protein
MRKMNGLKNSNAHSIFRNSSQNSFMINCSTFDENSEILWHMAHSEKTEKHSTFTPAQGPLPVLLPHRVGAKTFTIGEFLTFKMTPLSE